MFNNKIFDTWKNGKPTGQGTYTWANGDKYVGKWSNGMKLGRGTYTFSDGKIEKGIWKNGKFSTSN